MADIKRAAAGAPEEAPITTEFNRPKNEEKQSKWPVRIILVILILAVLAVGLFLVSKYTNWNILKVSKTTAGAQKSGWQAVFLTNGQVYFGQIKKNNDDGVLLKNIYYLQMVQGDQAQLAQTQGQTTPQQNLSLVKLGNELHGPTDEMLINKTQVLFIEEMKQDSNVVKAINDYLNTNK